MCPIEYNGVLGEDVQGLLPEELIRPLGSGLSACILSSPTPVTPSPKHSVIRVVRAYRLPDLPLGMFVTYLTPNGC
jgi:hypothetical protein